MLIFAFVFFSWRLVANQLPYNGTSGSPEALLQMEDCRLAMEQANPRGAVDCFHRVVQTDPNFARAWLLLGMMQVNVRDDTEGIQSMRKAITLEPNQPAFYRPLATALFAAKREEEALEAWKKLQSLAPGDIDAAKNIVTILVDLGRYQEALPQLEALVKRPGGAVFLLELGMAYAHLGQNDKAVSSFQQALQFDSSNDSLNAVAYVLTLNNLRLDLAQQYAEQGVRQRERETSSITLENLTYENLRDMSGLGGDWDTLGWVYFHLGKYDMAEKYLNAAWNLFASSTIGDHLAQVFEKQGRKSDAIETYARAIVSGNAPENSLSRLVALTGSKAAADTQVEEARADRLKRQTMKVDHSAEKQSRAEFFVLLRQGPKVVDVRFIKGAESLANVGPAIANAHFDAPFPDDGPTQFVRRGVLKCEQGAGSCDFELIPSDAALSVE